MFWSVSGVIRMYYMFKNFALLWARFTHRFTFIMCLAKVWMENTTGAGIFKIFVLHHRPHHHLPSGEIAVKRRSIFVKKGPPTSYVHTYD